MHGVLRTPVRWLPWWCTAGALLEIGTLDGLWLGATVGSLGSIESRESPWAVNSAVEEALGPGSRESLRWGTRGTSTARETRSRVDRVDRARSPTADEAALRRLWDEHAGALLGFVLRLTGGDRGRAEDVVQETLLQAWRHPEALDPARGSARPWLMTVARRLAIDQWRARQSRPDEVGDEGLATLVSADGVDEALDRWLVADALATLTPEHREALRHTYYEGRTVNEAAVVLGIPPGTVKSRVFYALRALKLALDERGVTA